MKTSKWLSWVVVLLAAGLLVMVLQRPDRPQPDGDERADTPAGAVGPGATAPDAAATGANVDSGDQPGPAPGLPPTGGQLPDPDAARVQGFLDAEEQAEIDVLIADDSLSNDAVAARLADLALDPERNAGLRLEAMGHAVNLLQPSELARLRPLLEQEGTPEELAHALMVEAINSPDPVVTMELALAAIEGPSQAAREEAVELVTFLLDLHEPDGAAPTREQLVGSVRAEIERLRAEGEAVEP